MHLLHTVLTSGWHWGTQEQLYHTEDVPQLSHPPKWRERPTNYDWIMSEIAVYKEDTHFPAVWDVNVELIPKQYLITPYSKGHDDDGDWADEDMAVV